jgi:signal peptidase I
MSEETQNNQQGQNQSPIKELGLFFWDLIKIVVIALAIIIPFRTFIAEPFVVSGSSMVANFHNKDYLIVDRISYRLKSPQRGDVIVFKYPKDTSQYFIKRIIGLPGEKVGISQGKVVIYNERNPEGKVLSESYILKGVETLGQPGPVLLGSGEYFVMGDNRTASSDSREWGILPKGDIVGKVWLRVLPLNSFGIPSWKFSEEYLN